MASEVFFTPSASCGKDDSLNGRLAMMLDESGFLGALEHGNRVAVKVHPGERGNLSYLRPALVTPLVQLLAARDARPFVTETTTLYCRERFTADELLKTAAHNGFADDTLGCPFVVGDSGPDHEVALGGRYLELVGIASEIAGADALLAVSHVTAHLWTAGLAGSIKQLGMGCAGRRTKAEVHKATKIAVDAELCTSCGTCLEVCKSAGMEIGDESAFVTEACARCGVCIGFCENEAIGFEHDLDRFAGALADAATGAASCFEKEKAAYVNFLIDITWHCDCEDFSDDPILPDIGVLVSRDPVAIDQAAADLLNAGTPIAGSIADKAEIVDAQDKLLALSGIKWWRQLEHAESSGLGTREYRLVNVTTR